MLKPKAKTKKIDVEKEFFLNAFCDHVYLLLRLIFC